MQAPSIWMLTVPVLSSQATMRASPPSALRAGRTLSRASCTRLRMSRLCCIPWPIIYECPDVSLPGGSRMVDLMETLFSRGRV